MAANVHKAGWWYVAKLGEAPKLVTCEQTQWGTWLVPGSLAAREVGQDLFSTEAECLYHALTRVGRRLREVRATQVMYEIRLRELTPEQEGR